METGRQNDVAKGFKMGIGFILAGVVVAAVPCVIGVLIVLYQQSGDMSRSVSRPDSPEQSWQEFVAQYPDVASCPSSPGPTGYDSDYRYYDKLRQHDGQPFGVLVLGCPDSEYYIHLYHFDAPNDTWIDSPRSTPPDDLPDVDIPATSRQWGISEAVIQVWYDDAEAFMKSN